MVFLIKNLVTNDSRNLQQKTPKLSRLVKKLLRYYEKQMTRLSIITIQRLHLNTSDKWIN